MKVLIGTKHGIMLNRLNTLDASCSVVRCNKQWDLKDPRKQRGGESPGSPPFFLKETFRRNVDQIREKMLIV